MYKIPILSNCDTKILHFTKIMKCIVNIRAPLFLKILDCCRLHCHFWEDYKGMQLNISVGAMLGALEALNSESGTSDEMGSKNALQNLQWSLLISSDPTLLYTTV